MTLRRNPLFAVVSASLIVSVACSEDSGSGTDDNLETPATEPSGAQPSAEEPTGAASTTAPTATQSTETPDVGATDSTPVDDPEPAPTSTDTDVPVPDTGGTGGETGMGDAGDGGLAEAAGGSAGSGEPELVERELLSQTGLFADIPTETLGARVLEFTPQFVLWTDGAEKRRWVHIPEGEQIDTSDIDEWKFPVGTKVWKEFSRDGIRIETRLLEKLPPERAAEGFEGWLAMAYIWNEEQTDAVAAPMGEENVKGTEHDVPSQEACGKCHDMRVEKPIGFSAVQLDHEGAGATLQTLLDAGWLSDPPAVDLTVPGDEVEREVLGYLHANCGHCHRARSPVNSRVSSLRLWLESESLASVEETEAYQALVDQYTESGQGSINLYRVVSGDPDNSELMRRITIRQGSAELMGVELDGLEVDDVPMPPLGTEIPDDTAIELVRNWILSLAPMAP